jgi:hypothetical protein
MVILLASGCASAGGDGADATVTQSTTTTEQVTTTTAAGVTTMSTTVASDPWGLTTADLPASVEEVELVLGAMPGEVGGYLRVDEPGGSGYSTEYGAEGPSLVVQFGEQRVGREGEAMSPAEWLTLIAGSGELDIAGSDLTQDVVWLYGSTTVGDESGEWTEYVAMWGEADGDCLFMSTAGSQEDLDAVVSAFVDTTAA